jgi:hypothetical protein
MLGVTQRDLVLEDAASDDVKIPRCPALSRGRCVDTLGMTGDTRDASLISARETCRASIRAILMSASVRIRITKRPGAFALRAVVFQV